MKTILIIALSASIAFAQTVYKVTPGSKGNQIILTVENESEEKELTKVKVKLINQRSSFNFRTAEEEIEKIERGKSEEAQFTFDAEIIDELSRTDTLRFLITGSEGTKQQKEILIGYELPTEYVLEQNYPNPFNPETTIKYVLPEATNVTLKVYDILGKEVAALVNENQQAGIHYSTLSTRHSTLASGVYFYRLTAGSYQSIKKMMLLK